MSIEVGSERCIECTGTELIDKAAEEYVGASMTVTYSIPDVDGGINQVEVFRDSMLRMPRRRAAQEVQAELAAPQGVDIVDPLRCAYGCDFLACAAVNLALLDTAEREAPIDEEQVALQVFRKRVTDLQESYRARILRSS